MTPAEPQLRIISRSPQDTFEIGERIGRLLGPGHVVALIGPLGAGKTQLAKGIACGAGVDDPSIVTSPTFTLVNEYTGRVRIQHMDAYRLTHARELDGLGFDEMLEESVVVIEWADRVADALPADRLVIDIQPDGECARTMIVSCAGLLATRALAALRGAEG